MARPHPRSKSRSRWTIQLTGYGAASMRRTSTCQAPSAHLAEVDDEPADVAAVGVGDDERRLAAAVEIAAGEPVHASRQVAAVLLLAGRALVLHERGLDLTVGEDEARQISLCEIFGRAGRLHPQHDPVAVFLEDLLGITGLERLAVERRVARSHDQPVKRREHADPLPAAVVHAPLRVEAIVAHALLAGADRLAAAVLVEREGGAGGQRRDQRQRQHHERQLHGLGAPTITRSNESGAKSFAATRCTSAAVTFATRSL